MATAEVVPSTAAADVSSPSTAPSSPSTAPSSPSTAPSSPASEPGSGPAPSAERSIDHFDSPEEFLQSAWDRIYKEGGEKQTRDPSSREGATQDDAGVGGEARAYGETRVGSETRVDGQAGSATDGDDDRPAAAIPEEIPAEGGRDHAGDADQDTLALEDEAILGPREFAKEINGDASAKAFFASRPELRDKVFAALRRDSENRLLRQYFPDVTSAEAAVPKAANWDAFSGLIDQATTPQGVRQFIGKWAEFEALKDGQGRAALDSNGNLQLSPQFNMILETIRDNELDWLRTQAERSGNDRLVTALDTLREEIAPHSPAMNELPEHLQAAAENIRAREEALHRQQREQQNRVNLESLNRVAEKTTERTNKLLAPALEKAGLSNFAREAAEKTIGSRLIEKLEGHQLYMAGRRSILSRAPGEPREKELLAHDMKYINQFLGPVTAQVIREATAGPVKAQETKQQKIAAQITTSRTEPRGTSVNAAPQTQSDPKAFKARIQEEYRSSHDGEDMPPELLFSRVLERQRAARQ